MPFKCAGHPVDYSAHREEEAVIQSNEKVDRYLYLGGSKGMGDMFLP